MLWFSFIVQQLVEVQYLVHMLKVWAPELNKICVTKTWLTTRQCILFAQQVASLLQWMNCLCGLRTASRQAPGCSNMLEKHWRICRSYKATLSIWLASHGFPLTPFTLPLFPLSQSCYQFQSLTQILSNAVQLNCQWNLNLQWTAGHSKTIHSCGRASLRSGPRCNNKHCVPQITWCWPDSPGWASLKPQHVGYHPQYIILKLILKEHVAVNNYITMVKGLCYVLLSLCLLCASGFGSGVLERLAEDP